MGKQWKQFQTLFWGLKYSYGGGSQIQLLQSGALENSYPIKQM